MEDGVSASPGGVTGSDAPPAVRFGGTPNPFVGGPRVLACVSKFVGWTTGRQRLGLGVAMLLPLTVLALAALAEGRLFPESVYASVRVDGSAYRLIGMSLVGDTMVWPFCILVPLGLLLLGFTYARSIDLLNAAIRRANPEWEQDRSGTGLAEAVRTTESIWRMRATGWAQVLRFAPWVLALVLVGYNFATCGYHLPEYPYVSDTVRLVADREASDLDKSTVLERLIRGETQPKDAPELGSVLLDADSEQPRATRQLDRELPLAKWDTDRAGHPLTFWTARAWTVFYYGLPPFLLAQLVALVWGVTSFLLAGNRWERAQKAGPRASAFEVDPLATDEFGGLSALSDAVITYLYSVSFFALLLGLSLLREGIEPSWHNHAMMLTFLPFATAGVLMPSFAVRSAILGSKRQQMHQLSVQRNETTIQLLELGAQPEGDPNELERLRKHVSDLEARHDQVRSMAEWPFDALTLVRMVFPLIAPFIPATIETITSSYL